MVWVIVSRGNPDGGREVYGWEGFVKQVGLVAVPYRFVMAGPGSDVGGGHNDAGADAKICEK